MRCKIINSCWQWLKSSLGALWSWFAHGKVVIWLSRATGIGYNEDMRVVHEEQKEQTEKLKIKANQVRRDVELLERELRNVLAGHRRDC